MNVIDPPLEEVDGASYRVNITEQPDFQCASDAVEYVVDEYEEPCDTMDPYCTNELKIEDLKKPGFRYRLAFHVPKALHGVLIGTRGLTVKRLQYETETKIHIPKMNDEGDIVIQGKRKSHIVSSYSRVQILLERARRTMELTHFISIPTNATNIRERFEIFKEDVLKCCSGQEIITDKIFNRSERLHLTIGVLTLLDNEERKSACIALEECQKSIIEPLTEKQGIEIQLSGIAIMNDDPSQVSVLYAKVKSDVLQKLADEVAEFYAQRGLMVLRNDHVRLHMTLMNTSFLEQDKKSNTQNHRKKRIYFDATKILKEFKDFDFDKVVVNSMHLSQMHAYSEDGYYLSSSKITWS